MLCLEDGRNTNGLLLPVVQVKTDPNYSCGCSAEFCYRCGVKWKDCLCGDWVPELLDRRAQQVVDREALWPLEPAIRQQRVVAMAQELQTNHECDHSGKFTKLEGSRRGK
ncbi:hypothetical protein VE03_10725, partial [Pseudogymnoascus sp. 23342-1-I1]